SHSLFPAPLVYRDLLSFPTRRSSDLPVVKAPPWIHTITGRRWLSAAGDQTFKYKQSSLVLSARFPKNSMMPLLACIADGPNRRRSEEHTSELQSRENLVCRLLLEKKK